jgi:Holliday junction resolvase RusA-like endonuclease
MKPIDVGESIEPINTTILPTREPIILPVAPMPKPRQTRSDAWRARPVVVRYRTWADEVRRLMGPRRLPERFHSTFGVPMPASWSERRRVSLDGRPHQQKPDVDNCLKALLDALLPDGDHEVWDVRATKIWTRQGVIQIVPLD